MMISFIWDTNVQYEKNIKEYPENTQQKHNFILIKKNNKILVCALPFV